MWWLKQNSHDTLLLCQCVLACLAWSNSNCLCEHVAGSHVYILKITNQCPHCISFQKHNGCVESFFASGSEAPQRLPCSVKVRNHLLIAVNDPGTPGPEQHYSFILCFNNSHTILHDFISSCLDYCLFTCLYKTQLTGKIYIRTIRTNPEAEVYWLFQCLCLKLKGTGCWWLALILSAVISFKALHLFIKDFPTLHFIVLFVCFAALSLVMFTVSVKCHRNKTCYYYY